MLLAFTLFLFYLMSYLKRRLDIEQEVNENIINKPLTRKDIKKCIAIGQNAEPFVCRSCGTFIKQTNNSRAHYNKVCKKSCRNTQRILTNIVDRKKNKVTSPRRIIVKPPKKVSHQTLDQYRMFYYTDEWRRLRFQVILKYGKICMACGETKGRIHVDHIVPRSKTRSLELDINNLQVLCEACNLGKSNLDQTDFRPKL